MNKQLDYWRSNEGWKYSKRNNNKICEGDQRKLIRDWGKILKHAVAPFPEKILEVGCNIGRNIAALTRFSDKIYGVEPNPYAVQFAAEAFSEEERVSIQEGNVFELPFENNSMDLVFTSGVLIHISPSNLLKATSEIIRVSNRYVVCIEYFSHKPEQVTYQGLDGYLFKQDFGKLYLDNYPELRVLDYGFLWEPLDSSDNCNWWLFEKR